MKSLLATFAALGVASLAAAGTGTIRTTTSEVECISCQPAPAAAVRTITKTYEERPIIETTTEKRTRKVPVTTYVDEEYEVQVQRQTGTELIEVGTTESCHCVDCDCTGPNVDPSKLIEIIRNRDIEIHRTRDVNINRTRNVDRTRIFQRLRDRRTTGSLGKLSSNLRSPTGKEGVAWGTSPRSARRTCYANHPGGVTRVVQGPNGLYYGTRHFGPGASQTALANATARARRDIRGHL